LPDQVWGSIPSATQMTWIRFYPGRGYRLLKMLLQR